MIRAIGFDYLGVIARLEGPSIYTRIAGLADSTSEAVKAAYRRHNADFQTGAIGKRELWRRVSHDIGRNDIADEIVAAAGGSLPQIDNEILTFVGELRGRGYKTGMLSNLATGTEWDEDLYRQGVDRYFDAVLLSGATGYAKPDPRAYALLASRLGVALRELVFIDDRPESFAGNEDGGMVCIVYTGLEDLKQQLKTITPPAKSE